MKSHTIHPIKGHFTSWRALLASVMENDDIERLCMITIHKDGSMHSCHFEMSREQTAFAALILQKNALE